MNICLIYLHKYMYILEFEKYMYFKVGPIHVFGNYLYFIVKQYMFDIYMYLRAMHGLGPFLEYTRSLYSSKEVQGTPVPFMF